MKGTVPLYCPICVGSGSSPSGIASLEFGDATNIIYTECGHILPLDKYWIHEQELL